MAAACQEIGVAEYLDAQQPHLQRQVSVGTATVAMMLNGLGFSNRRLYLVPQFFEHKPVEHLLGANIKAEDLNDDCLGRTLDWLYEQDVTRLFAGIAAQASTITMRAKGAQRSRRCQGSAGNASSRFPSISSA